MIPLIDNSSYNVPLSKIEKWTSGYPAVDIKQELYKMIAWCESNPTRKKTKRGVDRFINSWLARCQDSGKNYANGRKEQVPFEQNPRNDDCKRYAHLLQYRPEKDDVFN